jgi:hypothetical protein
LITNESIKPKQLELPKIDKPLIAPYITPVQKPYTPLILEANPRLFKPSTSITEQVVNSTKKKGK